jgi:TRAP-type C4-dicarboxylate transport system substrate-binding protein
MKLLRPLLRSATAALVTLGACAAAQAQVEWKFNNSYAPTRPESAHIRAFAADVDKRTGGKMKISVSEGGALGLKDADALRFMQVGTPELGFIWPPFLGRDAPALANLYVYGLVSTAEEHLKALPALKAVMKEALNKANVEVPGYLGFSIVDATLFCREPVRTLDELKRKKLRVGSREQVETFKRLGVAAQIVPQNELYAALQTGVETWRPKWRSGVVVGINDNGSLQVRVTDNELFGSLGTRVSRNEIVCVPPQAYFDEDGVTRT